MSRIKTFSSAILFTIGGGLPMLGSLVLLPFYTKAFTTPQFGTLSLLIGITLLIQSAVGFALDSYLAVHYHKFDNSRTEQKKLISTVFILELIIGVAISLVLILIGPGVFKIVFDDEVTFFYGGLMCVATAIGNAGMRTFFNLLINQKKIVKYLIWNFLFAIIGVALSLYFLFDMPGDVHGPLIGRMYTAVLFLLIIYVVELGIPRVYNTALIKGWMKFCWPVVVMNLAAWALLYINPYIINEIIDERDVGVYTFLLSLMFALEFIQTGLAVPLNAQIYEARAKEGTHTDTERSIHQVYSMLNIIGISAATVGLPLVVTLVINASDYVDALYLIPLFAIGYAWRGVYNMAFTVAMFEKRTDAIMINSLVSSVFQVLLTIALSMWLGLLGAIISFSLAKLIQSVMMEWRVKAQKVIGINSTKLNVVPAVFSALLIGVFFLMKNGNLFWPGVILCAVVVMVMAGIYWKDVLQIAYRFQNRLNKSNPF